MYPSGPCVQGLSPIHNYRGNVEEVRSCGRLSGHLEPLVFEGIADSSPLLSGALEVSLQHPLCSTTWYSPTTYSYNTCDQIPDEQLSICVEVAHSLGRPSWVSVGVTAWAWLPHGYFLLLVSYYNVGDGLASQNTWYGMGRVCHGD